MSEYEVYDDFGFTPLLSRIRISSSMTMPSRSTSSFSYYLYSHVLVCVIECVHSLLTFAPFFQPFSKFLDTVGHATVCVRKPICESARHGEHH